MCRARSCLRSSRCHHRAHTPATKHTSKAWTPRCSGSTSGHPPHVRSSSGFDRRRCHLGPTVRDVHRARVEMGSLNLVRSTCSMACIRTAGMTSAFTRKLREAGIVPTMPIFDLSHVINCQRLVDAGLLVPPYVFSSFSTCRMPCPIRSLPRLAAGPHAAELELVRAPPPPAWRGRPAPRHGTGRTSASATRTARSEQRRARTNIELVGCGRSGAKTGRTGRARPRQDIMGCDICGWRNGGLTRDAKAIRDRPPAAASDSFRTRRDLLPVRYWLVFGMFLLSMLLYVDRVCISAARTTSPATWAHGQADGLGAVDLRAGLRDFQVPSGMLADRYGPKKSTAVVVLVALHRFDRRRLRLRLHAHVSFLFGLGEAARIELRPGRIFMDPDVRNAALSGRDVFRCALGAAFTLPLVVDGWSPRLATVVWARSALRGPHSVSLVSRRPGKPSANLRSRETNDPADPPVGGDRRQATPLTARWLFGSRNVWLLMGQYFCSNFTFFFCLTWLFPYLKTRYSLGMVEAGLYAAIPARRRLRQLGGRGGNRLDLPPRKM